MIRLKNNVCISKISLERSLKTYEPCVPKNLMYNNVVRSSLNALQKWIHNLVVTNILGNDPKSIHQLMIPKLALQIND
jgi:hypothetical protein